MNLKLRFVSIAVAIVLVSSVNAATIFEETFDSSGTADVTILQQPDTSAEFVDYSTLGIPESPRFVAGSAATSGILLRANSGDSTEAAAGLNIIAGNVPLNFTGDYCLSFDVYMSVPLIDDGNGGVSTPSGSTEQLLWGVGTNDAIVEARNTRAAGTMGTWGWLAGENGYGTEDAAIFEDGTELADLGDTQLGEDAPFNAAFDMPVTPGAPNNAAANQWVEVDILVVGGNVSVNYNGVEFFNQDSGATDGFAMLGYEDPFGSITSAPDGMFGLFDNFVVKEVPEPASAGLLLFGLLGLVARRRR